MEVMGIKLNAVKRERITKKPDEQNHTETNKWSESQKNLKKDQRTIKNE